MNIDEKVKEIIANALGVSISKITTELASGEIEEWDSVGNLAVISAVQNELGLEIPIEDYYELTTVSAIIEKVKELTR